MELYLHYSYMPYDVYRDDFTCTFLLDPGVSFDIFTCVRLVYSSTFSTSNYIQSNDRMVLKEGKGCGRRRSWPNLTYSLVFRWVAENAHTYPCIGCNIVAVLILICMGTLLLTKKYIYYVMFTSLLSGHGVDLSRQTIVLFKWYFLLVSQCWQLCTKPRSDVILTGMALVVSAILAVLFN